MILRSTGTSEPEDPRSHSTVARPDRPRIAETLRERLRGIPRAVWILLSVIVAGAALLRTVGLRDLPAGLFCDEAAFGYNAWAILHYGVDENGTRLPLFLWSFTGYKNPVYLYAAMGPIGLLGLDEFSLRLTSALFGIATVVAIFFLGRALWSNSAGLLAAAFLAICPWHLHFSRIAFEVISFPLLFIVGLYFLVRFGQGRRTLPIAFFFLGLCLYSYAIAKLFVPLFLIGFGLLYLPTVWRRFREWLLAVPVLLLTVTPVVVFDIVHRDRAHNYFKNASFLDADVPVSELAGFFGRNYAAFFSQRFLFQNGDEIVRHAVRGHGELYLFFAPLLVVGLVALLLRRNRETKLVLLWLLLYPAGASLMNEIPSASRGFIGAPAFALIAAIGAAASLTLLGRITRYRAVSLGLQAGALGLLAVLAAQETISYLRDYVREYPVYSAPTYGGFQYGYREVIATMEPQRSKYPLLMLTATDVNQPQIFPLFYNRVDPREYSKAFDPGYLILDPAEYPRYSLTRPILYALRESDLVYFPDHTVWKRVVAPGGQVEFVVAEVRSRKNYIADWQTLGPFDNRDGSGIGQEHIDVSTISKRRYSGRDGELYWRAYKPQFVRTDLHAFFAHQDRKNPGDPTDVCAYALTTVHVPSARKAVLELSGAENPTLVWMNGRSLTAIPLILQSKPARREVDLGEGANALVVKSCKRTGGWFFLARLTTPEGNDFEDVTYLPIIPEGPPPPIPTEVDAPREAELVEGFDRVGAFRHSGPYADYRGETMSWWAYGKDQQPEVSWTTAPCPRAVPTTVAFTASLGEEPSRAELWINGAFALAFDTGATTAPKSWERGAYRLSFLPRAMVAGSSGVFLLKVPASVVVPGKPLELRVVPSSEKREGWFMIKGYRDTAAFERLSPESLLEIERPSWEK